MATKCNRILTSSSKSFSVIFFFYDDAKKDGLQERMQNLTVGKEEVLEEGKKGFCVVRAAPSSSSSNSSVENRREYSLPGFYSVGRNQA